MFNYNTRHENAGGAIDNEIATTVDASANWWGTATPAGGACEVAGPVDYTPWIDDCTDQDLVNTVYQPDLSSLHVDDDSPQTGATGRIQEGIDLVTGSTVNVEAGTYTEQVEIDKPLTLTGAGEGSTFIQGFDSMPLFFVTSGPNNNHPVVYVHDTTGVASFVSRNMSRPYCP